MSHGRTYALVPWPFDSWGSVLEREDRSRRSVDGSQVLVKWEGSTPAVLSGVTTYTHAEILVVLVGPAWTEPEPAP